MNRSEQIQEKMTALSELNGLLNLLLFEMDKDGALSILSEAQEQTETLIGSIEEVRHLIERGHARIQDALRSREGVPSHRENRLEDDDRKVESSSLRYEVPPVDTPLMGMSQPAKKVVYINYKDHNSNQGFYKSEPDEEDTKFQIIVSQTDPHTGCLQFYEGLDEYEQKELKDTSSKLIRKEMGAPFSSSQGTHEDGKVRLDLERQTWTLIDPIKIK